MIWPSIKIAVNTANNDAKMVADITHHHFFATDLFLSFAQLHYISSERFEPSDIDITNVYVNSICLNFVLIAPYFFNNTSRER